MPPNRVGMPTTSELKVEKDQDVVNYSISNKKKGNLEVNNKAQVLDASVDDQWFAEDRRKERVLDGRSRLLASDGGPGIPESKFSGREWPFRLPLPIPDKEELDRMEIETRRLGREAPPGPVASAWLERVKEWVWQLRLHLRGTEQKVCGCWRDMYAHWVQLLKVLPKKRRDRVLKMIREGVDLPWGKEKPESLRCPDSGGCPENHNLKEASEKVWDTLYEQIVEKAVRPWDCRGKDDVTVLPLGMFPIFWTVKIGSSKVRIVIDMRRLNEYLSTHYCTVELPSVRGGRLRHSKGDYGISFDLHSS